MMRLSPALLAAGAIACSADQTGALEGRIVGDAIPLQLVEVNADAQLGAVIFSDREQGHCVLCHQIDALSTEFQGNLGPDLTGIGNRLTPDQLRLRIVDIRQLAPETLMPSYYRTDDLHQVSEPYRGKTILTAEQVEHLVAYLASLTDETMP